MGEFILFGLVLLPIVFLIIIFSIIGPWKMFEKAGQAGWKVLIPGYNLYITTVKIAKVQQRYFWFLLVTSLLGSFTMTTTINSVTTETALLGPVAPVLQIIAFILWVYISIKLVEAFGQSKVYGVFLSILYPIMIMHLGFSKKVSYKHAPANDSFEQNVENIGNSITPTADPNNPNIIA